MTTGRLLYLDGLRGVLALIVFLHHFLYAFYGDIIFGGNYQEFLSGNRFMFDKIFAFTPLNILFNPGTAIHFFFLLSGYVQSHHYFQKPDIVAVQKSFFKRYFRLAIPTLVVIILVFVFHQLNWIIRDKFPFNAVTAEWSKSIMPDNLSFLKMITHGLFDCFMGHSRYYQVLWTMPTELYNSFMVLALLLFTHNVKNKTKFLLFWVFVQLFFLQAYYSVAFTVGMLISYSELNSSFFKRIFTNRFVKLTCGVVGVYFASYPFIGYQNSTKNSMYSLISFFEVYPHIISYLIGDALLFCLLIYSENTKRFLSKRVFLLFGEISFMLYLIHLLIIFSLSPFIYTKLSAQMDYKANLIVTGVLTFITVSGLSYLLTKWVDVPTLRFCNKYSKKLFGL